MTATLSFHSKKVLVIPTGVARFFLARRSWACLATERRDLSLISESNTVALAERPHA